MGGERSHHCAPLLPIVQWLHLSFLWNFARVCFYVLRASPCKHRVCAVLFPRPLLSLYACVCHVLLCIFSLTNIGFVQCFSLGSLLKSLYAYVSHVLLCVFSVTNIGFVQCFSLGSLLKSLYAYVSHVLLCVFSLTNIGFVQCLSLGSLLNLYAYLCRVMLCVLRLTNISFVQCFSLLSFKFTRLYWSCFVKTVKFVSAKKYPSKCTCLTRAKHRCSITAFQLQKVVILDSCNRILT